MSPAATFEFAPGLVVTVSGGRADVRHLEREYRPCRVVAAAGTGPAVPTPAGPAPATPALEVVFGRSPAWAAAPPSRRISGGHKSVGWNVTLSAADCRPTRVDLALRGVPASFARTLVQGYFVEPLLSVAAAEAGHVLLPAAGIVADGGLDVLVGRSRTGKSTLAARALAAGRRVIGDDQVIADAGGGWRPFPRRLRFYPDLRVTAPAAWAALESRSRSRLIARRIVATITGGFVRPSLAVDPTELGGRWDPAPIPAARILLLARDPAVSGVQVVPADTDRALGWAADVLREQRSRLASLADPGWTARLDAVAALERDLLAQAITGIPVLEVRIPGAWEAARTIESTAGALALEP